MFKRGLVKHVKKRDQVCSWQTFWSSTLRLGTTDEVNTSRLAFRGMFLFQQYEFPLSLYDGKLFRHKCAPMYPIIAISFGILNYNWGYQNGKCLLCKSKVMRTQPLHHIQPKPNSGFVVPVGIAMYQALF